MFKKTIICLGVFIPIFMNATSAEAWTWDDSNTLYLDSYGIRITRPNDRWRALNADYPELVELRLMRRGDNAVVVLRDYPFKATKKHHKHLSKHGEGFVEEADTDALLMLYRNAGYQFFNIKNENSDLFATGTNAERQILFLYFLRKDSEQNKGWFILEMTIPREIYLELKPQFDSMAASLEMTNSY